MSFSKDRNKRLSQDKRRKEKKRDKRKRQLKHIYKSRPKFERDIIQRTNQINKSKKVNYVSCYPPAKFSILTNTNQTVKFITELATYYEQRKPVYIELSDVEHIDYSAIAVLISIMASYREKGILFEGSFPDNNECRDVLLNAGFFRELARKKRTRAYYYQGVKNQLLTQAETKVVSELGLMASEDVSQTILGQKKVVVGLHRVLLELMQNTNNHAGYDQGDKHWWLSINHLKEKKRVSFVFVDYGVGIFNSLARKPKESKWADWMLKVVDIINFKDNIEVMRMMLSGEFHMTVTGKSFRGKGIPGIMQVFSRGQIKNLKFISNDVYANCSDSQFIRLKNPFNGTFVYWEVDESCTFKEWIGYDD